jgi:peptidoglycan/xylan/chitin deacetylase (PgdA/CDA1 family)
MDDFSLFGADDTTAETRTRAILTALRAHSLKAAMFVCARNIDTPLGKRLLQLWDDEGHLIANHTYSHRFYPRSDFRQYSADILRCEAMIKNYRHFTRLFRFPYLKEGETVEQRDRIRSFLAEHQYMNGAVTIDASDWYIDDRLTKRLGADPNAKTAGYRDYYLQHVLDRSRFYDDVARRGVGRSVKHTLLVHHNVLNAMFLGDVLQQYKKQGWKLIDAKEAYTDPVFKEQPDVLPAGDSLVLALAVQNGKMQRPRWPMEDGEHEAPHMDRLGL